MRHVPDGILRRILDEPFSVPDKQRMHYASCSRCKNRAADMRSALRVVASALSEGPVAVDAGRGLANVKAAAPTSVNRDWPRLKPSFSLAPTFRPNISVAAAALTVVLAVALVGTPAGSWASGVFAVFQPKQFQALPVTAGELRTLPNLAHFGTLNLPSDGSVESFAQLPQAEAAAGEHLVVPRYLPSGVPRTATFQVAPSQVSSFTFDASKAKTYAAQHHQHLGTMPAEINGASIRLTTRAAALTVYGAPQSIPQLVIGQTPAPSVTATGASLKTIEAYLLHLPGVSPRLASEIQAIGRPSTTLPIPVPINRAYSQPVTIHGHPGLAIGDNTGIASLVLWQAKGVVYGVGGQLTENQVLQVANSLH